MNLFRTTAAIMIAFALVSCGGSDNAKKRTGNPGNNTNKERREKSNVKQPKSQAQKNLERGQKFLEKNKKKEGVETTESGLQYKVLKEGNGKSPESAQSKVKVHYKGTFLNGDIFDSSYKRGKPASFPLNGVISGWTEGLQLMKEGAKYKFFIPYDLAYGTRGKPPKIGPKKTLVFEVELLEIL